MQQGGLILFVAKDKPGQTLIYSKALSRAHGNYGQASFHHAHMIRVRYFDNLICGQIPSTGPPTYQIIKVTNVNHMSVMKTSLMIIPICPRERFSLYRNLSRLVLFYKMDWAILLHLIYFYYLLLVMNYLIKTIYYR